MIGLVHNFDAVTNEVSMFLKLMKFTNAKRIPTQYCCSRAFVKRVWNLMLKEVRGNEISMHDLGMCSRHGCDFEGEDIRTVVDFSKYICFLELVFDLDI